MRYDLHLQIPTVGGWLNVVVTVRSEEILEYTGGAIIAECLYPNARYLYIEEAK